MPRLWVWAWLRPAGPPWQIARAWSALGPEEHPDPREPPLWVLLGGSRDCGSPGPLSTFSGWGGPGKGVPLSAKSQQRAEGLAFAPTAQTLREPEPPLPAGWSVGEQAGLQSGAGSWVSAGRGGSGRGPRLGKPTAYLVLVWEGQRAPRVPPNPAECPQFFQGKTSQGRGSRETPAVGRVRRPSGPRVQQHS